MENSLAQLAMGIFLPLCVLAKEPANGPAISPHFKTWWTALVKPVNASSEWAPPQRGRAEGQKQPSCRQNALTAKEAMPSVFPGKILVPFLAIGRAFDGQRRALCPLQQLWYHCGFAAKQAALGRALCYIGAACQGADTYKSGIPLGLQSGVDTVISAAWGTKWLKTVPTNSITTILNTPNIGQDYVAVLVAGPGNLETHST